MKKHSILPVLLVLLIAALFLGAVMYIVHFFSGPSSGLTFSNKIGVVTIEGTITDSTQAVNQIVEFRKDNHIKAIILRIDSTGGSVGASQEINREVMRTTPEKKVVASLGNVAASGGYYVAVAGDRIVANPGTLTGSIGVIMEFVQVKELLKDRRGSRGPEGGRI
jgi:protease-4